MKIKRRKNQQTDVENEEKKANRQRARDENIHGTDYIIYIICAPNDCDDDGCE